MNVKMKLAVAALDVRIWIAWRLMHMAAAIADEYTIVMSSRGKAKKQRWRWKRYEK